MTLAKKTTKRINVYRRKFRSQTFPIIWTDEKQSRAEAERRERLGERRSEEKESEGRRCRCAKKSESRDSLCFSNDLSLRRVEK